MKEEICIVGAGLISVLCSVWRLSWDHTAMGADAPAAALR